MRCFCKNPPIRKSALKHCFRAPQNPKTTLSVSNKYIHMLYIYIYIYIYMTDRKKSTFFKSPNYYYYYYYYCCYYNNDFPPAKRPAEK